MHPPTPRPESPTRNLNRSLLSPWWCMALTGCLLALTSPGWAETLTVGSGMTCDHSTLAAAVGAAQTMDIIELAAGDHTLAGEIEVSGGIAISIIGGHSDNCDGSEPSGKSTLLAAENERIFDLASSNGLLLDSLILRNGNPTTTGGAVRVGMNATLDARNSEFRNNMALWGGAIEVVDGVVLLDNVLFDSNQAGDFDGGAIRCLRSNMTMQEVTFNLNSADAGGAIHGESCFFGMGSGVFTNNSATDGGAIATDGDFPPGTYLFEMNNATQGGAFFLSDSSASIGDSTFKNNTASTNGGAIFVGDALLTFADAAYNNLVFEGNSAARGGAIYADEGSSVLVDRIRAKGNSATEMGSFLHANAAGFAWVASSVITGTPEGVTVPVIEFASVANAAIFGTTIASHPSVDPFVRANSTTDLTVKRNIFWGTENTVYLGNNVTTETFDCNVVTETDSLPVGHSNSLISDPDFLDPDGNYRLSVVSPARDLCGPAAMADGDAVDIEGRSRTDVEMADAGAYQDELLYADGFEIGSTDAWDSTTP